MYNFTINLKKSANTNMKIEVYMVCWMPFKAVFYPLPDAEQKVQKQP